MRRGVRWGQKCKEPGAGGGCARLLNLIGNWEEEEYCRSYRAALGGGVRRFDGFVIPTTLWPANLCCCNAAVLWAHSLAPSSDPLCLEGRQTAFRLFRFGAKRRNGKCVWAIFGHLRSLIGFGACTNHKAAIVDAPSVAPIRACRPLGSVVGWCCWALSAIAGSK